VEPDDATLTLDGLVVGTGSMSRTFPLGDKEHTLIISADGHASKVVRFHHAAPPQAHVVLQALPESDSPGSTRPPSPNRTPTHATGTTPKPVPPKGDGTGPKPTLPTDNIDPWDGQ